jgi:hypothetical protein
LSTFKARKIQISQYAAAALELRKLDSSSLKKRFALGLWLLMVLTGCDQAKQSDAKVPESAQSKLNDQSAAQKQQTKPIPAELNEASSTPTVRLERVVRPDDRRPRHNDARLVDAGVQIFESKRLKLYTDINPEVARTLPGLVDQLYGALEAYFGTLPPDVAGTDFQISGFLIQDMALFRDLGLLPEDFTIEHGAQRRNEFWMREQESDYYRRHLLLHEATHCFMNFMPGVDAPLWYLEGMAEYFGAHQLHGQQPASFREMPTSPNDFAGFGRITIVRKDVSENKDLSIPAIMALTASDFVAPDPYAWSWALCTFLDGNPHYHKRFQTLGGFMQGTQFVRVFTESFAADQRELATEWRLFLCNLQYGFDIARAAIDFKPGETLKDNQTSQTVNIDANRGWQSSGVRLEEGQMYQVNATGRFTLADNSPRSKPWVSEPRGITFRYFNGHPLGTLLGCLRTESGPTGGTDDSMLNVIALGSECKFRAPLTGTLYLRLNDTWNSLHDNRGHATVEIRKLLRP